MEDLPGTIKQRTIIEMPDDDDDDDDEDTFALIQPKGKARKEALAERERRRSEQQAAAKPPVEVPTEPETMPAQTSSPRAGAKRPRRGQRASPTKRPAAAAEVVVPDEPDSPQQLDAKDVALAERMREQEERLQKMTSEALGDLDDDDDDDVAVVGGTPRGAASSSSSGVAPTHLWLYAPKLMHFEATVPLEDLLPKIASNLGLLQERMVLRREKKGQPLDRRRSLLELGFRAKDTIHVEEIEEKQPPKLKLKLSVPHQREPLQMTHPADATFGDLLKAACELAGLVPSKHRLQFDGDTLSDTQTPADAELEDDDQIEVVPRR